VSSTPIPYVRSLRQPKRRGGAEGVYSVTGEDRALEFSSTDPEGEDTDRAVLRCQVWAPEAGWSDHRQRSDTLLRRTESGRG
jgi:hypothetical protein